MQLSDFPQFTIISSQLLEGAWALNGHFNHLKTVREGRSWLYISRADSLIGDLEHLDRMSLQARFRTGNSAPIPDGTVGSTLPWLDGWWQAYHVALIQDPEHAWRQVVFQSTDSTAKDTPGWQHHEHCMLCHAHIYPGEEGYVEDGQQWLCPACFQDYAEPHDLSFVLSV